MNQSSKYGLIIQLKKITSGMMMSIEDYKNFKKVSNEAFFCLNLNKSNILNEYNKLDS